MSHIAKFSFGFLLLSIVLPVAAQGGSSGSAPILEEVFVTAQKRAESIQDVPISVQAFDADTLKDAVVHQPIQLGEIVPGLQYSKQTGQANPYIRGIGTQNTAVGDESTVATYVDGVYIMGMQAAATSFNNIDHIEVLKGPQGTLFGRNTTGGLIHIITKDPVHEPVAKLSLDYASYDTVIASVYGSTGVSETVAADLSLYYLDQGEGFGENLVTGEDVSYTEDFVARSKWLIEPSDNARLVLSFDYANTETDVASSRGPIPGSIGIDGILVFQGCLPTGVGPAFCSGAAQALGTGFSGDIQDIQATDRSASKAEQTGASANFRYAFNGFDFVSITAYRDTTVTAYLDQDAVPLPVIDATLDREEEQFSQEIQLVSNGDGVFSWIVGGFYMDAEASYTPFKLRGLGLQLLAPGTTAVDLDVTQELLSYSVFGQGTVQFNEQWSLTGGARWTKDERDISGLTTIVNSGRTIPVPFQGEKDFSKATWRLSLQYELNNAMLYGSYSRGFKSGVYNSVVSSGRLAPAVQPEVVDAYEFGIKSDWFDNRLRANLAAFFYEYEDLQLQFVNAGITILGNATNAEITGAELELQGSVTENLDFRFGLAWLNAEYKDFPGGIISVPIAAGFGPVGGNDTSTTADVSGNKMARAPETTMSVGANYSRPVGDQYVFGANLNWYYNDGFYWFEDNRIKEGSYDILNLQVSFGSADESWRVRLWAKNLTDTEYSIFTNTGQFGDLQAAAPPMVAGVGVDFNF